MENQQQNQNLRKENNEEKSQDIENNEKKNEKEGNKKENSQDIDRMQKYIIYEKSKLKKSLVCKICGKAYTQNSGIWHHQKDKHGFFDPNNVEQIFPSQEKVKRGRPKLENQEDNFQDNQQQQQQKKQKTQEEFDFEELQQLSNIEDLDLDILQNEHIKMMLSIIIEYGEPNKQRKFNVLYNEFDDVDPFSVSTNEIQKSDWPQLFELYEKLPQEITKSNINQQIQKNQNQEEILQQQQQKNNLKDQQVVKMKNFCSKVVLDIKKDFIQCFIKFFQVIWQQIYGIPLNQIDQQKIQEQIIELIDKNQKDVGFMNLKQIKHTNLELKDFIKYFVSCTVGYIYDNNNDKVILEYFGN